jgi:ATP-binding cassette subfamily B (MDR/TAP) protein 1
VLGFGIGLTAFGNRYCFSIVGENLTFTMRKKLFEGIIYKHIAWFDSKDKAPGVLSNVLSEDIILLNGLTTETISIMAEGICTLVIGIIISFKFSWSISLITLGVAPLVLIGSAATQKLTARARGFGNTSGQAKDNSQNVDYYKESNALLSDVIMNYRTVISFGPKNIKFLMSKYHNLLLEPNKHGIKMAHIAGIFYGYSLFIRFVFMGGVFYIAAVLIEHYNYNQADSYLAVFVLFMSALGAGIHISNAPSISKA